MSVRSPFILSFAVSAICSITVTASSADLRVAVFSVPEDDGAVPAKVQVDRIFREVLRKADGFSLVELDNDAAKDVLTLAKRAVLQAKSFLEEAKDSFSEQMYEEAIPDAEKAAAILERVAGITNQLTPYLETLSLLGASRILAGQKKLGIEVLTRLAMLDPSFGVPSVLEDERVLKKVLAIARKKAKRLPRCTLKIKTLPPGAEVFLDGAGKGFAPVAVPRVKEGLHIVGARMTGYKPAGGPAIVACGDGEVEHRLRLSPSPGTKEVQAALGAVLADLDEPRLTESAMALAERLDVAWLIVGMVKRATTTVKLDFHLYSIRSRDKLRRRRVAIPLKGNYLGALRNFVVSFFEDIQEGKPDPEIIQARTPKPIRRGVHPSTRSTRPTRPARITPEHTGSDATRQDRGTEHKLQDKPKRKKKAEEEDDDSGDPLDDRDGTEDW